MITGNWAGHRHHSMADMWFDGWDAVRDDGTKKDKDRSKTLPSAEGYGSVSRDAVKFEMASSSL